MNYKNATFPNTREGFKSWCRTFKHLFTYDIIKTGYYKKDEYYLELNKVRNMSGCGYYLGISLRTYNPVDKDFDYVDDPGNYILHTFQTRISKFCQNNNLNNEYYKLFMKGD
jgi:hypothetical protein